LFLLFFAEEFLGFLGETAADVDLYLSRQGRNGLRYAEGQRAVVDASLDRVGIHTFGQSKRALEATVMSLEAAISLVFALRLVLTFAANGEDIVLDLHIDLVR